MNVKLKELVFIFSLTLFSLSVFMGYNVYESDQKVYMPPILKKLDESLYKNDFMLSYYSDYNSYSIFDELIIFIVRTFRVDILGALFLLSFITRFIVFWSVYKIAYKITSNFAFSLFAPSIYLYGLLVNATYLNVDSYLVPRTMAFGFSLMSVYYFMEKKYSKSTFLLAVSFLFHFIETTVFAAVYAFYFMYNMLGKASLTVRVGIVLIVFTAFAAAVIFSINFLAWDSFFLKIVDAEWLKIMLETNSEVFMSSWWTERIPLLMTALMYLISRKELKIERNVLRFMDAAFVLPVVFSAASVIMSDIFNIHASVTMNLTRSLLLWTVFPPILFMYFIYRQVVDNPKSVFYNASLAGIAVSLVFKESFLPYFFVPFAVFYLINRYEPEYRNIFWAVYAIAFAASFYLLAADLRQEVFMAIAFAGSLIFSYAHCRFDLLGVASRNVMKIGVGLLVISLVFLPGIGIKSRDYENDAGFKGMCEWIQKNTAKDDVFLADTFSYAGAYFRLHCLRSEFVTRKDGGISSIDREYAVEWSKRINLAKALKSDLGGGLEKINSEYRLDYLVSNKELPLNLAFEQDNFFVYSV